MTKPLVFTGNRFDRASHLRNDVDWFKQKLEDPSSRFLPMHNLKALIELAGDPCIDWRGASDIKSFLEAGATLVFLGLADFAAHFAIDVSTIENPKNSPIPTGENLLMFAIFHHNYAQEKQVLWHRRDLCLRGTKLINFVQNVDQKPNLLSLGTRENAVMTSVMRPTSPERTLL